jgi:hypothetical protein
MLPLFGAIPDPGRVRDGDNNSPAAGRGIASPRLFYVIALLTISQELHFHAIISRQTLRSAESQVGGAL